MKFEEQELYHIYNRGNYKQQIFFDDSDYRYFIKKIKKHLVPVCDIMSWSLMPNHFHFQIHCNEASVKYCANTPLPMQNISNAIKIILSSYSQRTNKKYDRFGNLFKQKTQCKLITDNLIGDFNFVVDKLSYATTVFHYIHLNPLTGRLVSKIEDWKYSSYNEYLGKSEFNLCNKYITKTVLNIHFDNFSETFIVATAILCPMLGPEPLPRKAELRAKEVFV